MKERRYRPLENGDLLPETLDGPSGPWVCSTDTYGMNPHEYCDFLEVHLSESGRGVVFRVSSNSIPRNVKLGECAILDRRQIRTVVNQLLRLLAEIEETERQ